MNTTGITLQFFCEPALQFFCEPDLFLNFRKETFMHKGREPVTSTHRRGGGYGRLGAQGHYATTTDIKMKIIIELHLELTQKGCLFILKKL